MEKKITAKKLLFVCTYNEMRSATAETVFTSEGWPAKSAGTARSARKVLDEEMIRWADIVFVMEKKHREHIKELFAAATRKKRIIVLGIPDNYYYMEEQLVELLKEKVKPHLA